jgi:hypothetical protein
MNYHPMMDVVRTSETSVYSNETTERYITEGSNLNLRHYPGSYLGLSKTTKNLSQYRQSSN